MKLELWDICAKKHKGNAMSKAANRTTAKSRDRGRILEHLRTVDDATCDEVVVALGINYQTCSGRFAELKADQLISPTNNKRPTRTGCLAQAYRIVEHP